MNKAIIDIVVTTAGRFDMLEKCLDALYREAQETSMNIIIIDNHSPAEERIQNNHLFEYHAEKDPKHNILNFRSKRLQQDIGFPGAANDGAREGKSPLLMFLSDDVVLSEGALDKIIRRMDDPAIGVLGIKLLFPLDSTSPIRPAGKVQHIGVCLDIRGTPAHPLVGWSADNPKCCISRECWAVTGACFTTRRNLWNKIGGFDLAYGKGTYEDMTFCMEARKLGQKIFVDCDILAYHYVGATVEKKQENYPLQMNQMIFASRYAQSGLMNWDAWTYW